MKLTIKTRKIIIILSLIFLSAYGIINDSYRVVNSESIAPSWKQKEIIITFWSPPSPSESAYQSISKENYNLIIIPHLTEGLNIAERNNLKGIFASNLIKPSTLGNESVRKKLDELIEKIKNHPALESYYIKDEPSLAKFSEYSALASYIREKDPSKLLYINLYPIYATAKQLGVTSSKGIIDSDISDMFGIESVRNTVGDYSEYLKKFIETFDPKLLSFDHYHFFKSGDGKQYFLNLGLVSHYAHKANIPFMNIIQASSVARAGRVPKESEIRFQVYTTLAYGGRGISYYLYWGKEKQEGLYRDGHPSPLASQVGKINSEIRHLSPSLMTLDFKSVYHTLPLPLGGKAVPENSPFKIVSKGDFVLGLFSEKNNLNSFMIVNRNYNSSSVVDLSISTGESIQELNRKTGSWGKLLRIADDRRIRVNLLPGDGRLFRVT
jgi:hypothetical protein